MPTELSAILFDFDGTLVDSEPLHYECWSQAVEPYGAGTDWDDYQQRFVGQSGRWAATQFFIEANVAYDEELIAKAVRDKATRYRARAPERLAIDDGICHEILHLPKNVPIGVVSSSSRLDVEPILATHGLLPRIAVLVCGGDVQKHKPHPEPYLTSLDRLRDCVGRDLAAQGVGVYEDSRTGIASAEAAGMVVRRVPGPHAVPEMLAAENWVSVR